MTNGNLLLYSSPTSVPLQPYSDHTEAPLHPYFIPAPALLQPHSNPISNVLQPYFQGYLPVPGRHVMMFLELTERVAGSTTPKPLTPIPWPFRNQMPRFFRSSESGEAPEHDDHDDDDDDAIVFQFTP